MKRYDDKLKRAFDFLTDEGFNVAYVALYGSQNYGLDFNSADYQSDFDMKAVVIPSLPSLVDDAVPGSVVLDFEGGQVDVKDVRKYFEVLTKANPAYLETLFTDHFYVNQFYAEDVEKLFTQRDYFLQKSLTSFYKAVYGMALEKRKALCHPYPTILAKIEKYGYDGKQLHHIMRLDYLLERIDSGMPYKEAMYMEDTNLEYLYLKKAKLNQYPLEQAKDLADFHLERLKNRVDAFTQNKETLTDFSYKKEFVQVGRDMLLKSIVREAKNRA